MTKARWQYGKVIKKPNLGLWKHPRDQAGDFTDLDYWIKFAKILEEGKFHGLFLADHLGIYDVYRGPANPEPALLSGAQFPIGDPLYVLVPLWNQLDYQILTRTAICSSLLI